MGRAEIQLSCADALSVFKVDIGKLATTQVRTSDGPGNLSSGGLNEQYIVF